MNNTLENPFYYLDNFETVLAWVGERYGDLLDSTESDFMTRFPALPRESRALFARMVMRKGCLFRASKLAYQEIGDTPAAAQSLIEFGWVELDPLLTLDQLFALLTKKEVTQALGLSRDQAALRKIELLESVHASFPEARRFSAWHAASGDAAYEVRIAGLCDRIRLMFFGNLHQDWSEFVLSDLGVFTYEKVEFSLESRAFHSRRDVDDYLHLHACRERFHDGETPECVVQDIAALASENSWLQGRRAKLLFQIGQHHEQLGQWPEALRTFALSAYPGARLRTIRVLEKDAQFASAMALAKQAEAAPESETEVQHLTRIMPRLQRKLGQPRCRAAARVPAPQIRLALPGPSASYCVEALVRDHLQQADKHSQVHYVENTLINSLFGLLCWDAIFLALPGAFFHPFHSGPADLHGADFYRQRSAQFQSCLSQLDSQEYQQTIRENFRRKAGIQSPFVSWGVLTEALLEQSLMCLPGAHLARWFARLLLDIRTNRAGLPDLIQFWPEQGRYRMIEVKGPGDKLQDNQVRWLDYCMAHDMPVAVCYVQWQESAA